MRAGGGQTPEAANDQEGGGYPEPVVEGKWAPWLVTLLVIFFCMGAWAGIYYFGKAVIGLLR